MTLRPVYPFGAPGEAIELYSGEIAVGAAGPLPGRIFADMAGDLQVRWNVTGPETPFDSGDVELGLQLPDLGPVTVPARVFDRWGGGLIMDASVGSPGAMCDRAIAHFTNLPQVFPWGSGRWQVSGAGWELTLEGRADHSKVLSELADSLSYVVTHVTELRRADGSSFRASEGAKALEAWQVAFSFALGRYVAPLAPVGFDAEGRRVWEQWASWRCDPVSGHLPWWDKRNGDDLTAFAELFLEAWFDPKEHDVTWHLARHLIAAHHRGTTLEAKIMLVHAALEYLSWVTYVLSGKRSRRQHDKKDSNGTAPATWHLQELLQAANVPRSIPADLVALRQCAQQEGLADGPTTLSWLRNRLVHPKDAGEPYRTKDLVSDAWRVVTQYGELLLLRRIGYRGKYLPRTDKSEWVNSVSVPWAI